MKITKDVPAKWTKTKAKDIGKKILKTGIYVDVLQTVQNTLYPAPVEEATQEPMAEEKPVETTEEPTQVK